MKILKEYGNPDDRLKAIQKRPGDALKLLFIWVKNGQVDFNEFQELASVWADSTDSHNFGAS